MNIDIQIQSGNTKHVDQIERSSMFPDLSSDYRDLRLEDIATDRYISEDDFGTVVWGTSLLDWKVENVEVFLGNPCLNISLWMEPGTLSDNDLNDFSMNLLLSDSLPVALRSVLSMSTLDDVKYPLTMDTIQSMIGFQRGDDPIIYGTIESYHENTTNIFSVYQDLIPEYNDNWIYTPEQGNLISSIPSDFDAEKAISKFSEKPSFKNFIQGLNDPFSVYSNYSETDGRGPLWKFSISERSNPYGWNESVLKDSSVTSGYKGRIDPVSVRKTDIGGVLTFSGAETALKRLMVSIDIEQAKAHYGISPKDESILDMEKASILLISDHSYPSVGLLNQGTFNRIDLALLLRSSDNKYETCMDMHTGQLLYTYSRAKV
jgi:hypothetical protein